LLLNADYTGAARRARPELLESFFTPNHIFVQQMSSALRRHPSEWVVVERAQAP
jgi:hypothetical protein